MIIGVSGKKGSGKDLIADIIQYLAYCEDNKKDKGFFYPVDDWLAEREAGYINVKEPLLCFPYWKKKKFADKLKDIVCLLIGCTREQLEDPVFKESPLGDEWINYRIADGFWYHSDNNPSHKMMDSKSCDKETYEAHKAINWQTAYRTHFTPRMLLQTIGTQLFRDMLHPDVWINATLADYVGTPATIISNDCPAKSWKDISEQDELQYGSVGLLYPNWIISDVRFPNEIVAIKKRGGIIIRVNRHRDGDADNHYSETALDNYDDENYNYVIDNNSTIEYLVSVVKSIMKAEGLL